MGDLKIRRQVGILKTISLKQVGNQMPDAWEIRRQTANFKIGRQTANLQMRCPTSVPEISCLDDAS